MSMLSRPSWFSGKASAFLPLPALLPLLLLLAAPAAARPQAIPGHPCLESPSFDFGPVPIGTRVEATLAVTNRCPRAVTVSKVSENSPAFSASLPAPVRIPARGGGSIPIAFSPSDTGVIRATLTLHVTNSKDKAYALVSGRGMAAPSLSISPASVALAMDPGEADTFRLAITNNRTSPRAEILVDAVGSPLPRPDRGWRVLYLNTVLRGQWEDGMAILLKSLDNVDTAENWDGTLSLPSLARLLEYDVVVVGAIYPWHSSAAGISNLLADYVEAGGKVLLTASALDYGGYSVGGGRMGEYVPLGSYNTTYGGPSGTLESHPITEGVGEFSSGGVLSATTTPGIGAGIPLGTYQSGYLVGAYHPDVPVVLLNISTHDFNGDIPRLVRNTLDYLGGMLAWMMPRPPYDHQILVVPEGETRELVVTVHSHRLPGGIHRGAIRLLNASDTDAVPLDIPVALEVAARGRLDVDPAEVDFGATWQGGRATHPVRLANTGNLPVRVSGLISNRPAFSAIADLPLEIPAFSARTVSAAFAPTGLGPDSAVLDIRSDAGGDGLVLALSGEGIVPPMVTVDPEGFEVAMEQGQSVQRSLRIRNPGGDSLRLTLRPVADSGAGTPGTGPEKLKTLYLHTFTHSFDTEFSTDYFMWAVKADPRVDTLVGFRAVDSLPGLDYMLGFDAVLVAANGPWADNAAMGDRLADYVDAGGRVCLLHSALYDGDASGLRGRITGPEYSPVAPGGGAGGSEPAQIEDHPIMEGIDINLRSDWIMRATATQGAGLPLGRYAGGDLIGAYNPLKPVVFLNVFPLDGYHYQYITARLIGNALAYMSDLHTWLQPDVRRLVLAPEEERDVTVTFGRLSGPGPGTFSGRLELHHNAPGAPDPLVVPATLTVSGRTSTASLPIP